MNPNIYERIGNQNNNNNDELAIYQSEIYGNQQMNALLNSRGTPF